MKELGGIQIAVLSAPVSQRRIGAHVSSSRSCSVQEYGSARASLVRVRSAGAVPSRSADTIRGETKASGANNRMCRSTLPSRRAIAAKLAARPCAKSSVHWRAFAIANQDGLASARFDRRVVRGHMYDALTVPGTELAQVTAIVLTFAMGRPDELFAISWVSSATAATLSRRRSLISSGSRSRARDGAQPLVTPPHPSGYSSCPPIACHFVAVQEPGIGTEGRWAENVSSAVLLTSTFSANAHGMHRGTDQKGQTGDILG
jgi:hypothetical protein